MYIHAYVDCRKQNKDICTCMTQFRYIQTCMYYRQNEGILFLFNVTRMISIIVFELQLIVVVLKLVCQDLKWIKKQQFLLLTVRLQQSTLLRLCALHALRPKARACLKFPHFTNVKALRCTAMCYHQPHIHLNQQCTLQT